jgi:hypothetical protein
MDEYLKGNYKVPLNTNQQEPERETAEDEFYKRALDKLGGSIAFILKPKHLLWRGNRDDEAKE